MRSFDLETCSVTLEGTVPLTSAPTRPTYAFADVRFLGRHPQYEWQRAALFPVNNFNRFPRKRSLGGLSLPSCVVGYDGGMIDDPEPVDAI